MLQSDKHPSLFRRVSIKRNKGFMALAITQGPPTQFEKLIKVVLTG
jgi:hypothetical protein